MLKHTDSKLRIYAVWFSMYPGDAPERWPAAALPDRRVRHYWDEGREIGEWYASKMDGMRDTLVPDSKGVEPPSSGMPTWSTDLRPAGTCAPTGLRRWGRTILHTKEALRQALEALE